MPKIIQGEPKKSIVYSGAIWDQVASPSECQHAGIPNNSSLGAVREFTIRRKAVRGMETALHIMTGWEAREAKKREAEPPIIKVVYPDIHDNLTRQAALDDWIESALGTFIEPWKPEAEKDYKPLPPLKVKPPEEVAMCAARVLDWYRAQGDENEIAGRLVGSKKGRMGASDPKGERAPSEDNRRDKIRAR